MCLEEHRAKPRGPKNTGNNTFEIINDEKWKQNQVTDQFFRSLLERIVQSLLSPVDLSQSGQVETFVQRFLQTKNLRRPHQEPLPVTVPDTDWVQLGDMDEHARWIENERQLLDLLGDDLRRQYIVVDGAIPNSGDLTKAVLAKQGEFVAVIDPDGRFKRLLDRTALLERTARADL